MLRRSVLSVVCLSIGLAFGSSAQAGVFPWAWDALFGPPGSMANWWYGVTAGPYGPYGAGGYGAYRAPRVAPYTAGYFPYTARYAPYRASYAPTYGGWTTSASYGPVTYGPVTYGYGVTNCCDPCASACSTCDTGTPADYSPPQGGNSPSEPTPTFRNDPPPDDFRPAERGVQDAGPPETDLGPQGGDAEPFPRPRRPALGEPSGESGEFLPGGNTEFLPGGNSESRKPVGEEPEARLHPLMIESKVAAKLTLERRRIVTRAGFRIPTVARLHATPTGPLTPSDTRIAAK